MIETTDLDDNDRSPALVAGFSLCSGVRSLPSSISKCGYRCGYQPAFRVCWPKRPMITFRPSSI